MKIRKLVAIAAVVGGLSLPIISAHAAATSITWTSEVLPASNTIDADSESFPTATATSGAPITYRIIDNTGSQCALTGPHQFTYANSGSCLISASADAFNGFGPVSTVRLFTLTSTHLVEPALLSRTLNDLPEGVTFRSGTSTYLPNVNISDGIGSVDPVVLESGSSGCYLQGSQLYAANEGACYIGYTATDDPAYYLTTSNPILYTVISAGTNVDVPVPTAADATSSEPSPILPLAVTLPIENSYVTVTAPAGILPDNSTLDIVSGTAPEAAKAGLLQVEINAYDANGVKVTELKNVLTLNLGPLPLKGNDVVYSQDGLIWKTIAKISGTSLPDDMREGYYLDQDENVVILTRHLTFYGTKRLSKDLILLSTVKVRDIGTNVRLAIQGGSGTGALTFISLTPKICSITQKGVVTALAAGECSVDVVKNGDAIYSSGTSGPFALTVNPKAVRVFTAGKKLTVQSALSKIYANKSVDLYLLDQASRSLGFVQKITATSNGAVRFTFSPTNIPKSFTIELKFGDQLLASSVTDIKSP